MKLLSRTMLTIALLVVGCSAFAAGAAKKGYLVDSQNDVVRSGFGLCWHTGFWTPADAIEECDGAIAKPAPVAATPEPSPAPAPAPATPAAPEPAALAQPAAEPAPAAAVAPAPTAEKVTFSADAFFDFDKAVLKP
ncbi:MAG: hypothetical protein RL369_1970, partial [Pseudomonadota bacterium]